MTSATDDKHALETRSVAVRQQLVEWMMLQHNAMSLDDETLHLAIVYVDTFLMHRVPDHFLQRHGNGSEPVEAKPLRALDGDRVLHAMDVQHPLCNKLKRLGITCIFVAAKVTEVTTPSANEFARHAQVSSFSREQLLLAERALLRELNYALIRPTAFSFAEAYVESVLRTTNNMRKFPDRIGFDRCEFADYGDEATLMKEATYYFVELSAYGHEGLKFMPSLIAAAAVASTLGHLKITWDEVPIMEEVSGYTMEQLKEPMDFLRRLSRDAHMIEEYGEGLTVNGKYEGVATFVFAAMNRG